MAVIELVSPTTLEQALKEETVVLVDARPSEAYWQGHIPGARHFDPVLLSLQRTDAGSLDRFHSLLGWALSTLGLTPDSRVVVVGAQNDAPTAKVAWALAYAGVQRIGLLDGGLAGWQGEQTPAASQWATSRFKLNPQTEYLATADDVLGAVQRGAIILDARSREEFDGQRSNAGRKGRVPGARFWDNSPELDDGGRYASADVINEHAVSVGASANDAAIVYCGGGGRAARTFVALQLAGRPAAVYPASWLEWGVEQRYPVQSA